MTASAVKRLKDYKWCSHDAYLHSYQEEDWLYTETILKMLSQTDGHQTYLDFVGVEDSDTIRGVFESKKWPAILGREEYISWVKVAFFEKKRHREVPDSLLLAPGRNQILKAVCLHYGVMEKELLIGRRGKENEPRNVAMYLCRILRNDTLIDLGTAFGMSGYSSAGSAVERVVKKIPQNPELTLHIQEIKRIVNSVNGNKDYE